MEKVVLGDDLFREYRQADFNILVTPHGGVVIKMLNVKSDEVGTGYVDCAVKKAFSRCQAGAVGFFVTREG